MSPVVPLRFNVAVVGKEAEFARAIEAREQHWAGGAGKCGDVRPSSRLTLHEVLEDRGGEMCDRLMSEHGFSEADFRYAARRLEASGDPDLETLAQHLRAMEMYAAEEAEKGMARDMNTSESMTRQLVDEQSEEYLREQRTAVRNQDPPGQHPRQRGWMPYPTNVRPVTEPEVDTDRSARGAMQPAMSQALRNFAREVAGLAKLSSNMRQRNRLLQRAAELERMSVKQYEREGASEVVPYDDPDEANNAMSRLARDMRDEAGASGAQPDDSFNSFDDWSDRPGADEQLADDVQDQQDDALQLDEDVPTMPRVPRAGRRVDEDENPGHADEPAGARKNTADDDVLQRVRRGPMKFGSGQPRGADRFGGERSRYSAFKRESMRESGDTAMTDWLLNELDLAERSSRSFY